MPVAIVHPKAIRSRVWTAAAEALRTLGPVDVLTSERPAHSRELARDAPETELLVAVGGDGTVHEVVNGLMERTQRPALGIVPLGTGNDFARSTNLPRDPAGIASMLAKRHTIPVDIGKLQCMLGGSEREVYFIGNASLGFAGEVTRRAISFPRFVPGTGIYLLALLLTLLRWRSRPALLEVDGQERPIPRLFNLNIANTRYYGGGMICAPQARPDDGVLDLVSMELGLLQVLRAMPENYRGNFDRIPGVFQASCRTVSLASDSPLLIQADGEIVGTTPAKVEVLPAALNLVVPN
ncbi:MAG: diacylglycerol kinase family lipid kinase [Armatimonadetes bacterium]|nr:diacylglycerol kinase family lipid kinase [Armatimonadota bacterium]